MRVGTEYLFLVDKSAYVQADRHGTARSFLTEIAADNSIATCAPIALEILYSARNAKEHRAWRRSLENLSWLQVDDAILNRAIEVHGLLAMNSSHRLPVVDLMVAAVAEHHDAEIVHYDKHFDIIADVTGQETRWIVPRGDGH